MSVFTILVALPRISSYNVIVFDTESKAKMLEMLLCRYFSGFKGASDAADRLSEHALHKATIPIEDDEEVYEHFEAHLRDTPGPVSVIKPIAGHVMVEYH